MAWGVMVGTALLYRARTRSEVKVTDRDTASMAAAFLLMLFLTAFSGLALLVLRHTSALPVLLPLHLGIVFSFFLTMPYGKFVHGLYRWGRTAALRPRADRRCGHRQIVVDALKGKSKAYYAPPRRLPPAHALTAIDAVASLGSLVKAAEHLGITRSAVSHRLALLEHALGFDVVKTMRAQWSQVDTAGKTLCRGCPQGVGDSV